MRLTRVAGLATPTVVAVHPLAPAPISPQRLWRRDLLALRAPCRAGWILAGDFNATIDHSPMRAILDAGCVDAAASTGQGLKPTWSADAPAFLRAPIDHVMASGRWRPARCGVLRIAGSDHRAVWAELVQRAHD
jgi:endonuclease/exonuclease/phosphatase (EEP) superfamily protein YafD